MLYGAPIWGIQANGKPLTSAVLTPLEATQNLCLRRIMGGYKRSPRAALEREAAIPPIDIQIEQNLLQHVTRTQPHPVTLSINRTLD